MSDPTTPDSTPATPAVTPDSTPTPTTPGYKTAGFWLTLALTIGGAVTASGAGLGMAGSSVALLVSGLGAAGYAAFRAFKKSADPAKPAWKTTEFWLSGAAALVSVLYAAGVVSAGGHVEQIVGLAAAALAAAGYQVTKNK